MAGFPSGHGYNRAMSWEQSHDIKGIRSRAGRRGGGGRIGAMINGSVRISRNNSRMEPLDRRAAFMPLQCEKFLHYRKLKRRERRAPPTGFRVSGRVLRVSRARSRYRLTIALAVVLALAGSRLAYSRPLTATGRAMEKSASPTTHSPPVGRWHTIHVEPAPGSPRIHFYDKLNPVWWLENADDSVPPAWYLPGDRHRDLKWSIRNPFHNFDHYVIGVADKRFSRTGRYPERNSDPHGGWDLEVARRKLAVLPFISYEGPRCNFYFGWREHGAFGIKLNFFKSRNRTPPSPAKSGFHLVADFG